jgi:uracil-DNA glycosylase family 4
MALVGEAPGKEEEALYEPFVGPAGRILNSNLHRVSISRYLCYITNISKFSVPNNDFNKAFWTGKKPNQLLLKAKAELLEELDELETNVIVALGVNPLWVLTGKSAIGKWRGSILQTTLPSGRVVKVIGTYHPSAILRNWGFNPIQRFDLRKALRESAFPERNLPQRNLMIAPTLDDVLEFFGRNHGDYAFDIENSPTWINCISFAFSKHESLCIPTTKRYWGSWDNLRTIWKILHKVLNRDCLKIGQNISHEVKWIMRAWGMLPKKPWYDTMIAQHSCYSELPKSLAFLASVYTDELYYKDDLVKWQYDIKDNEQYWTYNARDSAVTFEVKEALDKEMLALGVEHTYQYMMELLEPILFMQMSGLRVDEEKLDGYIKSYSASLLEKETKFAKTFGGVNPHSPQQVQKLAYETLGLKTITKKGGKPTSDKQALQKLSIHSPEIAEVIDIRGDRKLISTYLMYLIDPISNRFMFSINPTGAETFRLSSSSSTFGYVEDKKGDDKGFGTNAQNWPHKIRDIIIPDEGMEFTSVDLKGAESMIVAYWSNDAISIKIFEEGKNIHTFTACLIFNMSPEQVKADKSKCEEDGRSTDSKYFRAKKLRHTLEKKGSFIEIQKQLRIPAAEAKVLQRKFYDLNPNLEKLFRTIDAELKRTKIITTATGRKRIFFGRLGPDLVREAVAYEPQEVVGCVINHLIIRFYNEVCKVHPDISVKLQVHDDLLIQHPPSKREFVIKKLHELSRYDLTYHGRTFFIPIETKSGKNWRDLR